MNIHEYQAKEIFRKFGISVPEGIIILTPNDAEEVIKNFNSELYVVKAQIHAGGRGKAGGVKLTKNKSEAIELAKSLFGMNLVTHQTGPFGQIVRRVYVESGSKIKKEYYLSAVLDRDTRSITLIASTEGGVDIEEVAEKHPEKIISLSIDPATGLYPFHIRKIVFALGLTNDNFAKQFGRTIKSLYDLCIATDASQVEINPLVVTEDDKVIALDAKMNFDDNALFRQKEISLMRDETEENPLETRAANHGLNYVKMDGSIGCMVNGAGLAMATMDIIKIYGAEPANFLDVRGGATKERVEEAFRIILSDSNVKAVLVNIFGGIMRCDIIAEGIIEAAKEIELSIPLVVRLAGTNFELGKEILSNSGLKIIAAADLADAAEKVVNSIK
jgi:succinyl-CoA synthetase beta subunit